MRFEPRRAFGASRRLPFARRRRPDDEVLPPDLAFLRAFRPQPSALRAAVVRARNEGVSASEALLAHGAVSEGRFYHDLADHLGLAFVANWPELAEPFDVSHAVARGRVRLAGVAPVAAWLVAPTGAALALLREARRRGHALSGRHELRFLIFGLEVHHPAARKGDGQGIALLGKPVDGPEHACKDGQEFFHDR